MREPRNRCLRIMRGGRGACGSVEARRNAQLREESAEGGAFQEPFGGFLGQVRWSEKDALLAAGSACQNVNIWDMKMLQLAYRPEP